VKLTGGKRGPKKKFFFSFFILRVEMKRSKDGNRVRHPDGTKGSKKKKLRKNNVNEKVEEERKDRASFEDEMTMTPGNELTTTTMNISEDEGTLCLTGNATAAENLSYSSSSTTTTEEEEGEGKIISISDNHKMDTKNWGFEEWITNDVLFHMFSTIWTTDMRFSSLLVCKRWNIYGTAAFNPFCDSRALCYAIFTDFRLLQSLAKRAQKTKVTIDSDLIKVVCRRVNDEDVLKNLIPCGDINDARTWASCLRSAIVKGNLSAVKCLVDVFGNKYNDQLSNNECGKLIHGACMCNCSEQMLNVLLRSFSNKMHTLMGTEQFVRWCCDRNAVQIMMNLLDEKSFRTPVNVALVFQYALDRKVEPLLFKIISTTTTTATPTGVKGAAFNELINHRGFEALKLCCKENWKRCVFELLDKWGVDPSQEGQMALKLAVVKKFGDIVERLLKDSRCDPSINENEVVLYGIEVGDENVVTAMLKDEKVVIKGSSRNAEKSVLCRSILRGFKSKEFLDALFSKPLDPNEHNHAPLKCCLDSKNYGALERLVYHPCISLNRSELLVVIPTMNDSKEYAHVARYLLQSKRFKSNF